MHEKFIKKFKENLETLGDQQKIVALTLGMSESEFSRKMSRPFKSFTESEIRIIRYYTKSSVSSLLGLKDDRAQWLFATSDKLQESCELVLDRQAKLEKQLAKIASDISDIKVALELS